MNHLPFECEEIVDNCVQTEEAFELFLRDFDSSEVVYIDVEGTLSELYGVGFKLNRGFYYIPFSFCRGLKKNYVFEILETLSKHFPKTWIGHNIKYDLKVLYAHGLDLISEANQKFEDTQILAWLLDSRRVKKKDGLSLNALSQEYGLGEKTKPFKEVNFYDLREVSTYCLKDVELTEKLYKVLLDKIYEDEKLFKSREIYDEVSEILRKHVNLRSPRQVLQILPEEIRELLPSGKVQKSSSSKHLKAYSQNEVVDLILKYRSLEQMRRTFGLRLLKKGVEKDGLVKIFAEFRQDGTVSGRFKSRNPNLQNIPNRGEEGKLIRRAFVASPGT